MCYTVCYRILYNINPIHPYIYCHPYLLAAVFDIFLTLLIHEVITRSGWRYAPIIEPADDTTLVPLDRASDRPASLSRQARHTTLASPHLSLV